MSGQHLKNIYTFTLDSSSQETKANPIFPSTNTLNNYTTDLYTKNSLINTLSDGTATITGGYIDGIINPSNPGIVGDNTRAITKDYVDTSFNNISVPLNSLQRSSGTSFLGSNGLIYTGQPLGLKIRDTISYGSGAGTITSNSILNTSSSIIDQDSGSTREYLFSSNLSTVTISSSNSSNSIDASNIINTSFTRVSTGSGIIQDILPDSQTIVDLIEGPQVGSSFIFYYKYTGNEPNILLYGRIIQQGNFLVYNNPINVCTVPNNSIYKFRGLVESVDPAIVNYYILNQQSLEVNNQQIDYLGLKTNDFNSYLNALNDTYIIYPMNQSIINSTGSTTYTVDNIKGLLITRSGLTIDSTDSLPVSISSSFPIGSGLVSFTVQNISNYNLVVGNGSETDYTYGTGSRTIASSSVGTFDLYIDKENDVYTLYSTGVTSMNG